MLKLSKWDWLEFESQRFLPFFSKFLFFSFFLGLGFRLGLGLGLWLGFSFELKRSNCETISQSFSDNVL